MLSTVLFVVALAAILAWLGRTVELPLDARPRIDVEPELAADVARGMAVLRQVSIANAERMERRLQAMSVPHGPHA